MPDTNVTPLFPSARAGRGFPQRTAWIVAGAGALGWAAAALSSGLYVESGWGALTLVVLGALGLVATINRPLPAGAAAVGLACVALLVMLSAGSALWAQSVDAAWRETGRLALYAGIVALCFLAGRARGGAWVVAAAITGGAGLAVVWVLTRLVLDDAERAFIDGRLAYPLDYPNGLAFVFVVAALAACAWVPAARRGAATAMVVLASLGLDLAVLTQSRAVMIAVVAGAGGLMLAAGRQARALALLCALVGAALALPGTLEVYRSTPGVAGATPEADAITSAVWFSLGGALAAAALWALGAVVSARLSAADRRRAVRIVGGVVVAVLAAGALFATSFDPAGAARSAMQRFERLDQSRSSSRFASQAGYRYDLWRVALDQAADHPLLGVGAGNYADTYTQRRRNPSYVRQPHSLPLQVLAELGVLGLVLLGGFVAALVPRGGARPRAVGRPRRGGGRRLCGVRRPCQRRLAAPPSGDLAGRLRRRRTAAGRGAQRLERANAPARRARAGAAGLRRARRDDRAPLGGRARTRGGTDGARVRSAGGGSPCRAGRRAQPAEHGRPVRAGRRPRPAERLHRRARRAAGGDRSGAQPVRRLRVARRSRDPCG